MRQNRGPNRWQAPLPQVIHVVHKFDLNLLSSLAYFLSLYAKSQGAEVTTAAMAAATKAATEALAQIEAELAANKPVP